MKILCFVFLIVVLFSIVGCVRYGEETMKHEDSILIDVRSEEEFASDHIDGAINIPHDVIGERIVEVTTDKTKPLYLYCRSGRRVGIAIDVLKPMGYTNLHNLGGFEEAKKKWEK